MERLVRGLPERYASAPQTSFHLSDDTFPEPDFVVYERSDGLENLDGNTCLLAIEVGLASLPYDRGRKAVIYAAFGVRELWAIDGRQLEARIFRDPAPEGYQTVRDVAKRDMVTPSHLDGFALNLADFDSFEG